MPEVRRRRRSSRWRRLRRMARQGRHRPLLLTAVVLAGIVVLWVAWALWLAWSARSDLLQAADRAEVLRAALLRGDADGARKAMHDYQDVADSAASKTSGVTWSLFGHVPLLGDDAKGVATVANVLADIGRDGLPPVADAAAEVTAESFKPSRHRFPVDRIAAMSGPARDSEAAFDDAAERLDRVDSSRFIGPVQRQFDQLRTLVGEARATLESTYRASRLIPRTVGEDRPHYFLMVLQNNAEIRSSGGLPGALSLVRAKAGRVDIVAQTDMSDVGEETADMDFRLTREERQLFGGILGGVAVDSTLTPDFPRAAELIRARWERAMGGRLDGMVFVDPVAVSYLLAGTGQVAVPGYAPVNNLNVVQAVENQVYLLSEDRDAQSDYQQAVAKAVFNAFAAGRGDTVQAIRGLATAVQEGRVRLHFFDKRDQGEVAGTRIAGEFPRDTGSEPTVGVYLNDAGPTKMQYYLRYDAGLVSRSCNDDGSQNLAGSIELVNQAPPGLPPSVTGEEVPGTRVQPGGQQLLVAYLTSPVGGEITSLSINDQAVRTPVLQPFQGRSVATIGIRLDPGQRQTVEFEMRSGPGQSADGRLEVSPGAFPGVPNASAPSACSVR